MSSEWYCTIDGQKQGPMGSAQLKQLAQSGKLRSSDMIWKAGMDKWVPATSTERAVQRSCPTASTFTVYPSSCRPGSTDALSHVRHGDSTNSQEMHSLPLDP